MMRFATLLAMIWIASYDIKEGSSMFDWSDQATADVLSPLKRMYSDFSLGSPSHLGRMLITMLMNWNSQVVEAAPIPGRMQLRL
jgi:hypothetical protein